MRDVNRIKPFCDRLAELWSRYPDLRFGQMMWNILRYLEQQDKNPFYLEEDKMMEHLEYQLRKPE